MPIKSESKFLWEFILKTLKTPFILIMILFGKKKKKDLLDPLSHLWQFITEAKFTFYLVFTNILIFIASLFFTENLMSNLVIYPSDIFTNRFYTLITAGFLHANIIHLFGNMIFLFIFGRVIERKFGALKTSAVYFGALIISGILSSLIHIFLLNNNTPALGASGAIMGLVATGILLDPLYITYELIIPLPIFIVGWMAIFADISGITNPTEDGIGHFAHLGGFISIAFIAFFLNLEDKNKLKKGLITNIILLILTAAIYFYFLTR